MRTPPPVLPPDDGAAPRYQKSALDRMGPDGAMRIRAMVAAIATGMIALSLAAGGAYARGIRGPWLIILPVLLALVAGVVSFRLQLGAGEAVGTVAQAITFPTGSHTPYEEQFSFQDSLAARGDVAGALESFESVIADRPEAVAPRMRAAELYAAKGANPQRAAELFREIRSIPGVPRREAIYACSRLVDLYDGVLNEPGRALVELRRIIELYPGTAVAQHARDALPRMKARLADG
jgi:hypothetical protein